MNKDTGTGKATLFETFYRVVEHTGTTESCIRHSFSTAREAMVKYIELMDQGNVSVNLSCITILAINELHEEEITTTIVD